MKKILISAIILVLLAGGAYAVMNWGHVSEAAPEAAPVLPAVRAGDEVVADAVVVPVQRAALSLSAGGIVADVLVSEGSPVEAGQAIVRLKDARQQAAVAQAEARLLSAQAHLSELRKGARPQEIASAQAGLEAAQARLLRLTEGARPQEIASAQAALAAAQASLQELLDGPDGAELAAVQAELANAQAAHQQAQSAYDRVAWHSDVAMRPESLRLQEATNHLAAAQARYDQVARGAGAGEIAAAQARVKQAQADLERLNAPATAGEIAEAEAEVRRSQAQLELLMAGTRSELLTGAVAQVAEADAALAQARADLAETELRAPFAGTVAALHVSVGEQVAAGVPVVQLADLSAWQVETADLTELSVVKIQVGAPVTLRVDAIPDLELPGQVATIRSFGESRQGDITYKVVVQPGVHDARLRWNMTAVATIQTE